jgi:hypothetical protein
MVLRTVILVPVMYSEADTREMLSKVPSDYQETSAEFWSYVGTKLRSLAKSISAVYLIWGSWKMDERAIEILGFLQKGGTILQRIHNEGLVDEARAWYLAKRDPKQGAGRELLQEARQEIFQALDKMIKSSLGDTQVGVVFYEPSCRPSLDEDYRVIRMSPIDPLDYLNRNLVLEGL